MLKDQSSGEADGRCKKAKLPKQALDGFDLGRVVDTHKRHLTLNQSPLAPSRPGCAGDQGVIAGARVVDVVEESGSLIHVLDRDVEVRRGAFVPIWRDPERRERLERAHAAAVLYIAELARQEVSVASVEIVAGLAWVEIAGIAPELDLPALAERDDELEIQAEKGDRMKVFLAGQIVDTVRSPILASTGSIGGAEVRSVAALDGEHEALEIALPDGEGRTWWR